MRRILVLILWLLSCGVLFCKVDLNTAGWAELESLPITFEQAQAIYNYRFYISFFESVYDLRKIPEIDQATLDRIKPLVTVYYYSDLDDTEQRREEIYFLLERLGSQEGIQEGFTDIWEDYLMTPRDVNEMHFTDLLNMPNVSPIDAVAIRKRTASGDKVTDYRNMRSTSGLSFYGASNLRHYVHYGDIKDRKERSLNYQFKYEWLNFSDETREMYREIVKNRDDSIRDVRHSYWGYFNLDAHKPAYTNKYRMRYKEWKAGAILFNKVGENAFIDNKPDQNLDNAKYFASYESSFDLWGKNDVKVYLGNYRVTFGEGLVIENTDYYSSRKTGHGFSKRIIGITEDLSRSQEYALRGVAAELQSRYFTAAGWFSQDKKDAVVFNTNEDGRIDANDKINGKYHVFSYYTPTIRFDNDDLNEADEFFSSRLNESMTMMPRTNILDETMIGGRFEIKPFIGTHFGVTATQILYDNAHFVVPHTDSLYAVLIRDAAEYEKWKKVDSQIGNLYSTYKEGVYDRNYRTVTGFDWMTVVGNTSFQGEYAELTVNGNETKIGDDPSALVLSAYTQFENLYILSLYRNYDLDFDNPYNRGFSEQRKFNNTIFNNNNYVLTNQMLFDLYNNSPEPQAEEGFYFETRYRFSRYLTLNRTYLDIFERKADGRRTVRFQGDLDYRPINQLSLRGKYKHQINRYDDGADRQRSTTSETSGIVTMYLSNRDRLQMEYRYTQVESPPYPYLTNSGEPSNTEHHAAGQVLMHGDFISIDWTHNLNDRLRVRNAIAYWNGHSLSHWDWEDVEIDFLGEQGIKHWILIQNKIANNVYLSLKYKTKFYKTKELFFRTWWNVDLGDYDGSADHFRHVERVENEARLQIDWRF
ncbi:MAG: helix-hairpin-helix domain-containing protein [Candidatus Cloacimonetes bacterium]|nr:helix-hairpin-helix domain-containing protein [Candidatus Cloacimonadota bacterium]